MNKTIGIICEGPRDSDMLSSIIDYLFENENVTYRCIQPDETLKTEYANGWKGVWRWCSENGKSLNQIVNGISPKLDLLIVQMDGDVSRNEKVSHCACSDKTCQFRGNMLPSECDTATCPVDIPCEKHGEPPLSYVTHLGRILRDFFPTETVIPIIFVIPCDSTDAWLVAGLDARENCELIHDPWTSIISVGKSYHDVRIPKKKKAKGPYNELIDKMLNNWGTVTNRCSQAKAFEQEIQEFFSQPLTPD